MVLGLGIWIVLYWHWFCLQMAQAVHAIGLAGMSNEDLSSHPSLASLASLQSLQSMQPLLTMPSSCQAMPSSMQHPIPSSPPEDLVTAGHIEGVSMAQGVPQGVVQGLAHVVAQGMPQQIAQGMVRQPVAAQAPGGRHIQSIPAFTQVLNALKSTYMPVSV